ncbi:MAG: hormogonium polysaccharide secretion pseudopilin HpsB [Microcoleaceae cyanobacterium]
MLKYKLLQYKLLRHTLKGLKPSSESGFNLIESLVAIVLVAILLVAIGPVIAYSVGTRVQAKRIELASQAARTYADAVRAESVDFNSIGTTKPSAVAAPSTGTLTCNTSQKCTAPAESSGVHLYCVDFDGNGCTTDSLTDMVVQGISYRPSSASTTSGYCLGIRVYRANSFVGGTTLQTAAQDATSTNAIGNITLPLIQTTTEILPSGSDLRSVRTRIDATTNNRTCD